MITDLFFSISPDVLTAMGALISEFAGVMAVFLEGIINLSAFLCFAFSVFTKNPYLGSVLSIMTCTVFIFVIALFTQKTKANPFLVGLAVNILSLGITSLLSLLWFGTRGTISAQLIHEKLFFAKVFSSGFVWIIITILIFLLQKTVWGLRVKICGTDFDVLEAKKISAQKYRIHAWVIAAFCASITGCILMFRIQSFVPNMSAGRGWLALAAVFLGRKKIAGVIASSIFFGAAVFFANYAQVFAFVPSSMLLSFPYFAALVLFVAFTKKT